MTERNIAFLFAAWAVLCFVAVVISATATKNRIPNPYQDSRALEFGTKPRATYAPPIETWRDGK